MKTHSGRTSSSRGGGGQFMDNRELEEMEQSGNGHGGNGGDKMMSVRMEGGGAAEAVEASEATRTSSLSSEKVSFADLRKQKARDQFHTSGINITYNADGR